jgi:ribose transport system ATP-binding protein
VSVLGRPVDAASPRAALAGGLAFLSSDRPGEAIFPELSVQKNMVLTRLGAFLSGGSCRARASGPTRPSCGRDFRRGGGQPGRAR